MMRPPAKIGCTAVTMAVAPWSMAFTSASAEMLANALLRSSDLSSVPSMGFASSSSSSLLMSPSLYLSLRSISASSRSVFKSSRGSAILKAAAEALTLGKYLVKAAFFVSWAASTERRLFCSSCRLRSASALQLSSDSRTGAVCALPCRGSQRRQQPMIIGTICRCIFLRWLIISFPSNIFQ